MARIQGLNLAYHVRHIRGRTSRQRGIFTALLHLDGEACREASYALELPALRQPLRQSTESSVEWDRPDIAHYKVVVHISIRQAAAQPGILEIHQIIERRRIVDGLGERVRRQQG